MKVDQREAKAAGDREIAEAIETGLLLHKELCDAKQIGSPRADAHPPQAPRGAAIAGYYTPTQAYKDLLSWPLSVFDSLVACEQAPAPYSTALRPAHRLAISMMRTAATSGDKMQVNAMKELTDRVEGPVEKRLNVQATVSHVLVVPGDPYPRPAIDVETLPEPEED